MISQNGCKIIIGRRNNIPKLEKDVNEWLLDNPQIKIINSSMTSIADSCDIAITIFYSYAE